ncbi:DUF3299 domain-containing protein [Methylophaga sp. SB9B]|uniref:DUF3299 domain-containing protein n=1 Tax=Methylophaga sp. SB9B TaxID=2570356 RepID=UPI0010A7E4DF|nr:DUF3299 domain-containing protein [Methylophaga sp. SB9B]THK42114.1 DUF3299 domain-containing protein [Methylophaga sp. SB9B]
MTALKPAKFWLYFLVLMGLIFTQPLLADNKYQSIDWVDLMPEDDLEALMNPPEYLSEIEDGSFEDEISSQLLGALENSADDRYQQALTSAKVKPEYDQRQIRLPGFMVPVEMNEQQLVTEFFLVPFFGACIHYPPPPPNQIIYVTSKEGVAQQNLYDPYWVEGTLTTTITENEVAVSAYSMKADNIELYTE